MPTRSLDAATATVRLFLAITLLPLAAHAQRGVPQDGFPSWHERVLQVLVNRVRADPNGEVKACSGSTPRPPLAWQYNLNRTARFHSANLARTGTFQHDSPCTLVPNIADLFPPNGSCDGSAACACVGGTVTCNPTCTSWSARMTLFGSPGGGRAENAAYGFSTPRSVHSAWMGSSGHCANILGSYVVLGAGRDGSFWTQNFSSSGSLTGTLIAGGHEPQSIGSASTDVEFRTNYYDTRGGPLSGAVNIDGTCTAMTLERGSATNGTHLATVPLAGTACRRYAFVFTDPAGATVLLPETGSYGVGGAGCADWTAQAPPACGGAATSTPTNTRTATPSSTPPATQTSTRSATPSRTPTMTATATPTRTRTATPLPTWTPTITASHTPTHSPSQTATASPTPTPTWTPTVSPTPTPMPTQTATATPPATQTPSVTPTLKATYTASATPSASASPTATATATATRTPVEACSCYGDADRNNFVNFADFGSVQRSFGRPADPETGTGDGDCNGFVNFADFGAVQANFGRPCD